MSDCGSWDRLRPSKGSGLVLERSSRPEEPGPTLRRSHGFAEAVVARQHAQGRDQNALRLAQV